MNTDVAICSSRSYIAVTIRDASSSFCMAYAERLGAMDPLVGEAFAMAEAVNLAKCKEWNWMVFECLFDSL